MELDMQTMGPMLLAAALGLGGGGLSGHMASDPQVAVMTHNMEESERIDKLHWQKIAELREKIQQMQTRLELAERMAEIRHPR